MNMVIATATAVLWLSAYYSAAEEACFCVPLLHLTPVLACATYARNDFHTLNCLPSMLLFS
jgi:hypothetical protein